MFCLQAKALGYLFKNKHSLLKHTVTRKGIIGCDRDWFWSDFLCSTKLLMFYGLGHGWLVLLFNNKEKTTRRYNLGNTCAAFFSPTPFCVGCCVGKSDVAFSLCTHNWCANTPGALLGKQSSVLAFERQESQLVLYVDRRLIFTRHLRLECPYWETHP